MTNTELETMEREILQRLPRVLERDPQFTIWIEGLLAEKFPRRDEFARLLEEVKLLREEMNRRFEQVTSETQTLQQEMQTLRTDLTQQMGDLRTDLTQQMGDLRDWVELIVGRLQTRSGKRLEDVVAGALRLALKRPDIVPDKIRLRQKFVDVEGKVGRPGKSYEVDIVAEDGRWLVVEVKSVSEWEDVDRLAEKVELVRILHPQVEVEGVLVTLEPEEEVRERCRALGVTLVGGKQAEG